MPVVDEQDRETIPFHGHFEGRSALDDLARQGAERVLQMALEEEVDEFLQRHGDRRDDKGNRQVVRNGRKPARDILTGAGPLEVQQPRVRDKHRPPQTSAATPAMSLSYFPPGMLR